MKEVEQEVLFRMLANAVSDFAESVEEIAQEVRAQVPPGFPLCRFNKAMEKMGTARSDILVVKHSIP